METRRRREEAMALIAEANRKALAQCTGDEDCTSSVHHPHCWSVA